MKQKLLLLILLGTLSQALWAKQTLIVGITQDHSVAMDQAHENALIAVLNQDLPNYHFVLKQLSSTQVDVAIERHELDFLMTDPLYYRRINSQYPLSTLMATRINIAKNQVISHVGGVMVRLKERSDIQMLTDLNGKTVACLAQECLSGFLAYIQSLEQADISVEDFISIDLKESHENVVNAVLNKKIDVGFIRTGVLEQMIMAGLVETDVLEVINSQVHPALSHKASTSLSAESPFIALPKVPKDIVKAVSSALHSHQNELMVANGKYQQGFKVIMDDTQVDLERKFLGMPLYDDLQTFYLNEVANHYKVRAVLITFLAGLALFLTALLWYRNRSLSNLNAALKVQNNHLDTILDAITDLIWLKDKQGHYLVCNKKFEAFYGIKEADIIGKKDLDFKDNEIAHFFKINDETALKNNKKYIHEAWVKYPIEDRKVLLQTTKVPMRDASGKVIGVLGVGQDITNRKAYESALELLASVFENTQEGVMITDLNGNIVDVNPGFSRITGYAKEEVVGKNANILHSEKQGKAFYQQFWHSLIENENWSGEIWNRTKGGPLVAQYLSINCLKNTHGDLEHYIGVFTDITFAKDHEAELQALANFDSLTGLPNRRLLDDRLSQAVAQSKRSKEPFAVAFLDLDGFKPVNDLHGHGVGDRVLITIGQRIQAVLREEDTVSRLGGDEFVIVLRALENKQQCEQIIQRILKDIYQPIEIEQSVIQVSACVGIAQYSQNSLNAKHLLEYADQAMYMAKLEGKNSYKFCDRKKK